MTTTNYLLQANRNSRKVRWLCRALRVSRFIDVQGIGQQIEEKIERIRKRKPELDDGAIHQIVENLLVARVAKRMQEWRVKPYTPKIGKGSPTQQHKDQCERDGIALEDTSCCIFRERHFIMGKHPAILIPGFVPDGNEAFFLLRRCFLKHGPVFYVNYPSEHFLKDTVYHQIYDMVRDLNRRRIKSIGMAPAPFLVGTSFGCRIILSFLNWLRENQLEDTVQIRGLVLLSPVLCLEDVVDTKAERQKTLVGRAVSLLYQIDPKDDAQIEKAMRRARTIFSRMFLSGRDQLDVIGKRHIPVLAIEDDVLKLLDKNMPSNSNSGFFRRFMGLKGERPIEASYLTDKPTLVLFAENESDVMTPNSPTFSLFTDIEKLRDVFPNGQIEFVYSNNAQRKVTHSDLIFQAPRYLAHLEPWLKRHTS